MTTARTNLEAQKVIVQEVRPYQPGLTQNSFEMVTGFPARVNPGDKVILYEEQGQVRAYSVVREPKATTADVSRLDNDLKTVKADVNQVRTSSDQRINQMAQDLAAAKAQIAEKDKELAAVKQQVAKLNTLVKPEELAKISEQQQKLQEFQVRMEQVEKLIRERPR
jgi:hypothetical protein